MVRQHWKLGLAAPLLIATAVVYPFVGGIIATRVLCAKVAERISIPVTVGSARAGLSQITFFDLAIVEGVDLDIRAAHVTVPFSALWGAGEIWLESPQVRASSLADLKKLRRTSVTGNRSTLISTRVLPSFAFAHGLLLVGKEDAKVVWAEQIEGRVSPNDQAIVKLANLEGHAAGLLGERRLQVGGFGARTLHVSVPLVGMRPHGAPSLSVTDGFVQALPSLGLSGISGQMAPKTNQGTSKEGAMSLMFSGSYGGSQERLWNAAGEFRLGDSWKDSEGTFGLRAERFMLDKIKNVLPPSVTSPENTSIGGGLGVRLHDGVFEIKSNFDVSDLSVFHAALSPLAVEHLSLSIKLDATLDPQARVVELRQIEGRLKDLVGTLSGRVELAEGKYLFKDGRSWPWIPKISLALDIPKIPCDKLLSSFPTALVPRLAGFALGGIFQTHLETQIDYASLDDVTLEGQVGIGGCKAKRVPSEVESLSDPEMPITHSVKVPSPWDETSLDPQELLFVVGADSDVFAAFADVSPHLINAFLTTEDSGFFKHHGFATREFRTALKRNLEDGRFKQGASSITMQMVKNLLLSQEKTLSRKLQELFLVWYLEQVLSKERIMELYLNAIEFGPRLYGIGPAARHYFGKNPSELNPVESAFFSSILPSPKRRYVHYCRGQVSPAWDKYLRRILGFMHKRGRLTDEELEQSMATPLVFDMQARTMTEKQCLDWISRITASHKPEVEPTDDTDANE